MRLFTSAVSLRAARNSSQLENSSVRMELDVLRHEPELATDDERPTRTEVPSEPCDGPLPGLVLDDVEHDADRVHEVELALEREARIGDVRLHDRDAGLVRVTLLERPDGRLRDLQADDFAGAEDLQVEVDPVSCARPDVEDAKRRGKRARGEARDDRVLDRVVVEARGRGAPPGRDRLRIREGVGRGPVPGLEEPLRVVGSVLAPDASRLDVVLDELRPEDPRIPRRTSLGALTASILGATVRPPRRASERPRGRSGRARP